MRVIAVNSNDLAVLLAVFPDDFNKADTAAVSTGVYLGAWKALCKGFGIKKTHPLMNISVASALIRYKYRFNSGIVKVKFFCGDCIYPLLHMLLINMLRQQLTV